MSNVHILRPNPNDGIANYYDQLIQKHGATAKGVDASSDEALRARWSALSGVMDLSGKTILDIGCGWGKGYLDIDLPHGMPFLKSYSGIDISPKMIEAAKKRFPTVTKRNSPTFEVADLATYEPKDPLTGKPKQFDLVVSQGLFYKLPVDSNGFDKAIKLVDHMFRLSKEAIAISAVCDFPFGASKTELRLDTFGMLKYLRTHTPFVTMRTDHHLGDVVYYAYRNKQGG